MVSLLLPVYNNRAIVGTVLRCLDQQDYSDPWELIVCDDGSVDDLLGLVRTQITRSDVSVRYVWQPDYGFRVGRSRNNGIRLATGSLLIFLDGDIAVPPNFISNHLIAHRRAGIVVCGTRYWLSVNGMGAEETWSAACAALSKPSPRGQLYSDEEGQRAYVGSDWPWLSCISCNFSFRRTEEQIFFDEDFLGWGFEDDDFAYRLHRHLALEMVLVPKIWGIHLEPGPVRNTPLRPNSPGEVHLFIRNLVHFARKHTQREVFPALRCIGAFDFDSEAVQWRRAERPDFGDLNVERLLAIAREYVRESGA